MMQNAQQSPEIISSTKLGNVIIEVLQYEKLQGSTDPSIGEALYFAQKSGINLRQVRIRLNGDTVATEQGTLQYYHGKIQTDNKVLSGGLGRRILNTALNGEAFFRPTYSGYGDVYLEPTFNHFIILDLKNDSIVLDAGMFYCATSGLEVSITSVKNISSAVFGSDGLTQTVVKGTGILVVQSPVPENELRTVTLNGDKLHVDGKFALMRNGNVKYSVSMSNKGVFKTFFSGEGLLETFEGTGTVWLAPTYPVYSTLSAKLGKVPPMPRPQHPNT